MKKKKKCRFYKEINISLQMGWIELHKSGTGKVWEILLEFCWQSHLTWLKRRSLILTAFNHRRDSNHISSPK
jgi:hypothetical protein